MVPVIGDLTTFVLGYKLVTSKAMEIDGGLPDSIRLQMVAVNMSTLGIGFIPIVGDIINATIKPNSRNAALFESWLVKNRSHNMPGGGGGAEVDSVNHPVKPMNDQSAMRTKTNAIPAHSSTMASTS